MIQRQHASLRPYLFRHVSCCPARRDAEVNVFARAERVRMTEKRRHLSPTNQQQMIEVGLPLLERIMMADGVVVGHGYEIQPQRRRLLQHAKLWAKDVSVVHAGALSVAMSGVIV